MGAKIDVAFHEAGHAVIALDERIGVGEFIRSSLKDGYAHFAPDIQDRAQANPSIWAPKVIKALLAGQLSQERYVTMEGFEILDDDRDGWAEDNRKCKIIAEQGLGLTGELAETEIARLRAIVTERTAHPQIWSAIKAIAKVLNRSGRIPGTEAEAIFNGIMGDSATKIGP
jgi:hypothetical protein